MSRTDRASVSGPDELLDIIEDEVGVCSSDGAPAVPPWRVLVVDDDDDVHDATRFALRGMEFLGRPVEATHATCVDEALAALVQGPEYAVAFIDVVMETDDAGLVLVSKIREAGHSALRIVLRTGQPGYAPELDVIATYDINDYRLKSELDRRRLLSTLTTSLRSYHQVRRLEDTLRGLEVIVDTSDSLVQTPGLGRFAEGVLAQIAELISVPLSGVVAIAAHRDDPWSAARLEEFVVTHEVGRFKDTLGMNVRELTIPSVNRLELRRGHVGVYGGVIGLVFSARPDHDVVVYLEPMEMPSMEKLALLEVYAQRIAMGFENVALLNRLDMLAYLDPALRIPNENAFLDGLRHLLEERVDVGVGILVVEDLDTIASAFGPMRAQQLLSEQHIRLQERVPELMLAARVADHQLAFAYVGQAPSSETLESLLRTESTIESTRLPVTSTIAMVRADPEVRSANELLRYARATILHSKSRARGKISWFERGIIDGLERRGRLQVALYNALLTRVDLAVHVQPKVDIVAKKVVGGEALARWTLNGQPVSPADFIPVAEACGLTHSIQEHVVEVVGRWARLRRADGHPPMPIAVNLAMRDIQGQDFADRLLRLVHDNDLGPDEISFEVTESGVMHDPSRTRTELGALVGAGFKLAIDDFGTGYSSLAQLDRLPFDTLKIDRAFIQPLEASNAQRSIAAAAIAIARGLGLKVVAEGIETEAQHNALLFLGCHECQGYLYGRPVPIEEFQDVCNDWRLNLAS
ncbi:MAG: EAL domain-containing protein [Sandaracinaceae bacterium]|nr:EAL domain-containing protein [Sandaracinaceae bacterium]MCB9650962.1 EAL domain-containing protein [Deltaproteobacteria bacterium]